ncbi:MAG: 50S ribosomal protein L13 [Clostridiales bacterium]|jgi:large subunit ribosomal protein L13|nr:50S ribosomal protein L13 [Clostridiales bacterium]
MANEQNIEHKWYLVDAAGQTMGRLASQVATILRGKHKPEFTPHVDCGDFVIVINSDQIVLTGNKLEDKYKYRHTLHMGGLKATRYKDLMRDKSDDALYLAIKGMLPKNSLGRKMLKKVRIYKDADHKHEAQQPQPYKLTEKRYN